MSSTSETGHAKNVANYEKLVVDVTALGTTFNPSKARSPSFERSGIGGSVTARKSKTQ